MATGRPPGRPKVKPDGLWARKWRCSSCGEYKYETQFHRKRHPGAAKVGSLARPVQYLCKDCIHNYQAAWQTERRMKRLYGDAG